MSKLIFLALSIIFIFSSCRQEYNPEKELKKYNALIKKDSTNAKYYFMRSNVYFLLNDSLNQMKDIDKTIKLDPTLYKAYFSKGILLYNKKKFRSAISCLEKVNKLTGTIKKKTDLFIADSYLAINSLDTAKLYFDSLIILKPNDWLYYNYRYKIDIVLRDYNSAIKDLKKYSLLDTTRSSSYIKYIIAGTYFSLGNYNDALIYVNKAIGNGPNEYEYYYLRGLVYYKMQDSQKAIEDLNHSTELNIKSPFSYYKLGVIFANNGNSFKAKEIFDKALGNGFKDWDLLKNDIQEMQKKKLCNYFYKKYVKIKDNKIKKILDSGRISSFSDLRLVDDRIANIFYEPSKQEEYRKLLRYYLVGEQAL